MIEGLLIFRLFGRNYWSTLLLSHLEHPNQPNYINGYGQKRAHLCCIIQSRFRKSFSKNLHQKLMYLWLWPMEIQILVKYWQRLKKEITDDWSSCRCFLNMHLPPAERQCRQ